MGQTSYWQSLPASLALVVLSGMSSSPAAGSPEAQSGWETLKQCASRPDAIARHACMDDVLRKAGLLLQATSATPASAPSTPTPPVTLTAAAPVATTPATAAPITPMQTGVVTRASAKAEKSSEPDQFEVTLTRVDTAGDGKLLMTTSDGTTWMQSESQTLDPAPSPGQTMIIKRKSLGGFMCEPARYVTFRCYRVR